MKTPREKMLLIELHKLASQNGDGLLPQFLELYQQPVLENLERTPERMNVVRLPEYQRDTVMNLRKYLMK